MGVSGMGLRFLDLAANALLGPTLQVCHLTEREAAEERGSSSDLSKCQSKARWETRWVSAQLTLP